MRRDEPKPAPLPFAHETSMVANTIGMMLDQLRHVAAMSRVLEWTKEEAAARELVEALEARTARGLMAICRALEGGR